MWAISLTFSPSVFHLRVAQCTGDGGAEYLAPRAGEQRTAILVHATRRRKKEKRGAEKKKKKSKRSRRPIRGKPKWSPRLSLRSLSRGVEGEPPGKQLQLIHAPVCTALRSPQGGRSGAAGPASASCSWGAVTSQIPASLCLPSCSDSAGVYSALAGPAPALAAARRAGGRRRRQLGTECK